MTELPLAARRPDERVGLGSIPFFLMHVLALGVFFVPFSWDCVAICVAMYYLRMFGITAGFHRYFAHRGYKTSRAFQFVLAWLGCMSSQKGVLWWSGHHRHHHKYSDMPEDVHSPKRGFWWSHMLWILCKRYDSTPDSQLREFAHYPELVFLNKHWAVGPTVLGVTLFLIGGAPWLFWGFFLSTVFLWHGTFTINSLAHVWGGTRYETGDTSRNNFFLSVLTMGEGWHNNHHFYQSTANNGFFWWEIDMSYYVLKLLSWFGVVWDLRTPPAWALAGRTRAHAPASLAAANANPEPLGAPVVPSVLQVVESVAAIRQQVEQAAAEAAESASAFRARISERAAEVAESAARAASEAAESARISAAGFRSRVAARAAEAAQAAAQAAQEASDAASKMAADLKTRVAQAAAEAAAKAARVAAEAAEAAQQAAASVAGMTAAGTLR